jgi:glucose-6-phosphate 1-dehydrogenase
MRNEMILYDCMNGDRLLFKPAEIVETGWALVQPILDLWDSQPPKNFPNYSAGSWGPKEADDLLLKDHRKWFL